MRRERRQGRNLQSHFPRGQERIKTGAFHFHGVSDHGDGDLEHPQHERAAQAHGKGEVVSATAAIVQLGERQTEDLKVPGSILGLGTIFLHRRAALSVVAWIFEFCLPRKLRRRMHLRPSGG